MAAELFRLHEMRADELANDIASFQKEIGKMGYKFQFITLAGFHS